MTDEGDDVDGAQVSASTSAGDDPGAVPGAVTSPRRDHLERAVLQVLWDHPEGIAATDVVTALGRRGVGGREVAVTTVLTVLERMRVKGLVTRWRSGRSYRHRATATREESTATAMLAALGQGADRPATLARLVAVAEPDDLAALREALLAPTGGSAAVSPVCGPGLGATGARGEADLPVAAGTGCGGSSGLCGCCTCEPGCACCAPLATTG